jgi:hypothetical protein
MQHRSVLPDHGFYEERFRLTGPVALSLAASLCMLAIGLFGSQSILLALAVLTFVAVTVPSTVAAVSRRIAFRADPMGITFGAEPLSWPGRSNSSLFISWSEVERIVLYQGPKTRESGMSHRLCIGIQRRPGALPLPSGNKPARRCPVPGLTEGATRQVVAWRLDRERLTALTAAVAPGVPVVYASPGIEGPGVEAPGVEGPFVDGPGVDGPS